MFCDVIPQIIVVGIVDNDAFNGAFRKNPFSFQNYKMTLYGLLKNNEPHTKQTLSNQFSDRGRWRIHYSFSVHLNRYCKWLLRSWNAISREDFPNGYTLVSFDTSADFCPKAYFDPVDKGGLKLELQFGSALTQAVNIIVYAEFGTLIEINGSRDVIHNFAE